MDIYKQFKTDETKEVEGVWVSLSPTARIKVARMGNKAYRDFVKRKSLPYRQAGIIGDIPPDVFQQIVREAVAETILVDWEGITTDGVTIQYSKEQALVFCTDLKDFYNLVLTASDNIETFRVNGVAVLEKN
jgi:hypothetical protein